MTEAVAEDSFSRKFIYKLAANLVGVLLSFFQAGFVSRALGPRSYGDYNLLISFFSQFIGFVEMRSATFLYTSISRNRAKTAIVGVYFYVALAISVITVLFTVAAITLGVQSVIWPDQNAFTIVVVSVVALIVWYADVFAKICDAMGVTISLERARAINRILLFISIAVAMRWSVLNIRSYLTLQFIAALLLIVVLSLALRRTGAFHGRTLYPLKVEMRSTLGEMFSYSYPLFVYTLFAFAGDYADRWLLQRFNGSFEQGLFSLARNLGLAFNVLIYALHPLVMREFSLAFEQQDMQRARRAFTKLITPSYTLSAFFLCYAAVNADGCIRIVGGSSFEGASTVFAVMAFLPIIHNYSMLSGSALYAAHKTTLIRNIGFVTTPLSIVATFLLVGPREYGALNLGALGLAVKVVALEFIGNNIVLYFNSRMLGLSFRRHLFHQVSVVALLTAAAFVCREAALLMLGTTASSWFAVMVVGGFLYLAISLLAFYWIPSITGVDKREALAFLKEAMSKSQTSISGNPPIP
jgi:O-antigen/teichoic acid export membrane protein